MLWFKVKLFYESCMQESMMLKFLLSHWFNYIITKIEHVLKSKWWEDELVLNDDLISWDVCWYCWLHIVYVWILLDGGATSSSNDPLQAIGGLVTRSKTKRMKQALKDLILKIKKKEDQCELRVAPNWVTLLQIDEGALRPTWRITSGSSIYKARSIHGLSWSILVDY